MRVIRGFVAGVVWGSVVAGLGLVVISQVAPGPAGTGARVAVGQAPVVGVVAESAPDLRPKAGSEPPGKPVPDLVPNQVPDLVPNPVADLAPDLGQPTVAVAPLDAVAAPAPVAPGPTVAAVPTPDAPGVAAASEAPAAHALIDSAARPDLPVLTGPASTVPATPPAPGVERAAEPAGPPVMADLPPPAPDEGLLMPAPQPVSDPAPARVAIELVPVPEAAPLPRAALPAPDASPDLPLAKPLPLPLPDATTRTAPVDPQTPVIEAPAPLLQPVTPIIAAGAPRTLIPDPGLGGAAGVKVGQLPRIGAAPPDGPDGTAAAQTAPAAAPPVQRFARAFENPDGKPLFSVLLRDTGAADLDRAALAQISFPVTFVIDPMMPGAGEAAAVYRRGGQEVLMLATGIPAGATAGDLEQSFQSLAGILPEAVGVIDQPQGGFQGNRPLAAQVVPILAAAGRGLVTFDVGLNAADQEARRAALPAAMIFRRLDAEGEATPVIRRYLDRAAFKAAQEGQVVVLGDTRPETIAALLEWAVEGRAASVALAPVTAVMSGP